MYYATTYSSPIGLLTIESDGENIIGLWTQSQKYQQQSLSAERIIKDDLPVLTAAQKWLERYFAGEKPAIGELPLAPRGSEFRQGVWQILRKIPYGEVVTYGDIARQMAAKMGKERMSAQAVGGAVGHNPISIIIPCHRVIGASGSLTGYGGGIDLKIRLLELEQVDMSALFRPKKGTAL
jgi:methylated-DNA-[protein]-cysteine S-methyltransferase